MKSLLSLLLVAYSALAASPEPCWQAPEVKGDPLLFIQSGVDSLPKAMLLRSPEETPTLQSASGEMRYEAGRDFLWQRGSRELRLPAGSRIPFKTLAELHPPPGAPNAYKESRDGRSWLLYSQGHFFHDLQSAASYRARDDWNPPRVPAAPDAQLARLRAKLKAKIPLTMVVLGDSISTGLNASMTSGAAPKQEGYVGLVARGLEERFGSKVRIRNLSISGKSSPWGLEQVPAAIAESPDLFICAFGMNDASSRMPVSRFADNIRQIVERVQSALPDCDVVVIASMTANPEWSMAAPELYPGYAAALEKLAARGVAIANVTRIWSALLERKGVLDLSGNGLNHPNDFGHRVYADVILETIGR